MEPGHLLHSALTRSSSADARRTPLIYSFSYFNLGACSFVWGAKPTKDPPVATGLGRTRNLWDYAQHSGATKQISKFALQRHRSLLQRAKPLRSQHHVPRFNSAPASSGRTTQHLITNTPKGTTCACVLWRTYMRTIPHPHMHDATPTYLRCHTHMYTM